MNRLKDTICRWLGILPVVEKMVATGFEEIIALQRREQQLTLELSQERTRIKALEDRCGELELIDRLSVAKQETKVRLTKNWTEFRKLAEQGDPSEERAPVQT